MKTQSNFLFRFIKQLTPTEKRYFKLYASRHVLGDKNNYLKLFEVIEQQEIYDEEVIKTALEGEAMVRHFSSSKTKLKEMILDALDEYERNSSAQEQLKKQLHQVKLLALRGFKKEALRLLEKVQKRAVLSDLLEIALLATKYKVPLLGLANLDLEAYAVEEKYYADLIQHQTEYNFLHFKTYQLLYRWSTLRSEENRRALEEIMGHPLLKDENQAMTFRAKMQFYDIQSSYYNRVTQDIALSYEYQKANLRLFEENEERLKLTPSIYYIGFCNFLNTCGKLRKYQEIVDGLENLKAVAKRYGFSKLVDFQKNYFYSRCSLLLGIYHATRQIDRGLDLLPETIKGLKKYDKIIKPQVKNQLYRFMVYFYFTNGRLSDALTWAGAILNQKSNTILQEIGSLARIYQVLIHYEWGNDNYVIGLIRTYQRHLKKQSAVFQTEVVLLKCVNRLAKMVDKARKKKLLEKLKTDLLELQDENSSELPVLNYFPFLQWIEAQIAEKTIQKSN